jgi:hypothetical protein
MKGKMLLMTRSGLIAGGILALVLCAVRMLDDMGRITRSHVAANNVRALAIAVEAYRLDHEAYPSTWQELLSGSRQEIRSWIETQNLLNDKFHDSYEYRNLATGFVITVTAPRSHFWSYKKIERVFKLGEVYEDVRLHPVNP